ncbi:MAG TPA: alpha/beta hydrolase-fold protein, partial [Gemmataceae bacterium]|nr:alpha/beta hydrolase-fold protein [Gemmataceae bacterium]
MRTTGCGALLCLLLAPLAARAHPLRSRHDLDRTNRRLHGQVIDYTNNHGADRRLWSPALGQKRDMYVYLPPGFDPRRQYPVVLFLHGYAQDEAVFLNDVIWPLDRAIGEGRLPPVIVAAPDGSLRGVDCLFSAGSFYINSKAGNFEDFLVVDVWHFLLAHYPIRPEAEAHVLLGLSMGGGAAFHHAIKYPQLFRVAVGVFPPLNLRWEDCHGRYLADFDPCCWGWRTNFSRPHSVVGRFYGVITIRSGEVLGPLYGRRSPDAAARISRENPVEMLEAYDVRPGDLELYVGYAGRDEFNIDAQVESFLYVAKRRGLEVGVGYEPNGHHDRATALKLLPGVLDWLA